jgi:hypothetical protein
MKVPRRRHQLAALLCVAAAFGLAACGGGSDTTTASAGDSSTASNPDLSRWCELVTELDAKSAAVFNELGKDGVPSNDELAAAQLQVLTDNADLITELQTVAPTEIRDDFQVSLDSARQRAEAGDPSQPPKSVADANLRLQQFRMKNCPKPSAG